MKKNILLCFVSSVLVSSDCQFNASVLQKFDTLNQRLSEIAKHLEQAKEDKKEIKLLKAKVSILEQNLASFEKHFSDEAQTAKAASEATADLVGQFQKDINKLQELKKMGHLSVVDYYGLRASLKSQLELRIKTQAHKK